MSKIMEIWNNQSAFEKRISVITTLLFIEVIAISIMGLLNILPLKFTNSIAIPSLGVMNLLNGIRFLKINKKVAIMSFVTAIFILVISISIFSSKIFLN